MKFNLKDWICAAVVVLAAVFLAVLGGIAAISAGPPSQPTVWSITWDEITPPHPDLTCWRYVYGTSVAVICMDVEE